MLLIKVTPQYPYPDIVEQFLLLYIRNELPVAAHAGGKFPVFIPYISDIQVSNYHW